MKRFLLPLFLLLICACSTPKAPLIGVTGSRSDSGSSLLSTNYTEAVSKAGGVPVILPAVATQAEAEALLARLDGIVFSGGKDVNPAWYGEEILNETVVVDTVRDHSDSLLAVAALGSGKPILAICRGEQLINVILGGSLYQDIPSQISSNLVHGGGNMHKIGLEEGSVLARIFGPDSLIVNSFHHQGIKEAAPGIRITARSADGFAEAYETDRVFAVQFHPEKLLQCDDRWLPFFAYFIDRCTAR